MKKRFNMTLSLILLSIVSFSQPKSSDIEKPGFGSALLFTHNFECMVDVVFSQVPVEYDLGKFADANYQFTKVADDFNAVSSFNTMRFWGLYDIKPTETFLIEFYDGNPGQPGTNVVHSFNVTVENPIPTGFLRFGTNGSEIFQFNIVLPQVINLTSGWVSVSRTTLPYSAAFAWLNYQGGGGNTLSYDNSSGTWISTTMSEAFFCFGNTGLVAVPVSNWALYFGILLMVVFVVIRFRRMV